MVIPVLGAWYSYGKTRRWWYLYSTTPLGQSLSGLARCASKSIGSVSWESRSTMSPSIVVSPLLVTTSCRPSRSLAGEVVKDWNHHLSCVLPQSAEDILSQEESLIWCQTGQTVDGEKWKPAKDNNYGGDMDPSVLSSLVHFRTSSYRRDTKERISLLGSHCNAETSTWNPVNWLL